MANESNIAAKAAQQGSDFECHLCGNRLSRKQRLLSHYEKVHPKEPLPGHLHYKRKIYKVYDKLDSSLPLPKRSLVRLKQSKQSESNNVLPTVCSLNDENINVKCMDEGTINEQFNVEAVYDIEEPVVNDDSTQTLPAMNETIQLEKDIDTQPKLTEYQEKCMAILSFITKMKLTGSASESLLKLLKMFSSSEDSMQEISSADLRNICSDTRPTSHDFCSQCQSLFPSDESVILCPNRSCDGLRYLGPLRKQHLKRQKSYFASISVQEQLVDIIERNGNLESMGNVLNEQTVTLMFKTDGVPLYSSSSVSLWPVYLVINELPPVTRFSKQNIIVWGLWQGKGKPKFQTFFQPFVEDMIKLKNQGFQITVNSISIRMKAELTIGTMDLQAKAYVMEMTQHNGKYGCLTCEEPGEVFTQGKGHARGYPVRPEPAPPIDLPSLLNDAEHAINNGNKSSKGIMGVSMLLAIDYFNPINSLVPDYMHGVLLGTTKKLLQLWFSSHNSKKSYFLGPHVKEIAKRLISMQPTDGIPRMPRSVENNLTHWKASELQNWLLYYAIPCLDGIMEESYYENLCFLSEGFYILLSDNISNEELVRAEHLLQRFQVTFENLYGQSNCGLNVHNIGCHLVNFVRHHGPLWAWSCFPFEDMNGTLLKSVHGTGDVCKQLLCFLQAQKKLIVEAEHISNATLKSFTLDMLTVGKPVSNLKEISNCSITGRQTPLPEGNEYVEAAVSEIVGYQVKSLLKVLRVRVGKNTIWCREYERMQKRICYAVVINGDVDSELALVEYYVYERECNRCFAVVKTMDVIGLINKNVHHIAKVKETAVQKVIPVDKIIEKVLLLQGNQNYKCVVRMPNLFGQCG